MSDEELARGVSQVQAILTSYPDVRAKVIDCDSRVQHVQELGTGDPPPVERHGRGGTRFQPVFDHLAAEGIDPTCIVSFTDMQGSFDFPEAPYFVLWVATTDTVAPWGETVRLRP